MCRMGQGMPYFSSFHATNVERITTLTAVSSAGSRVGHWLARLWHDRSHFLKFCERCSGLLADMQLDRGASYTKFLLVQNRR